MTVKCLNARYKRSIVDAFARKITLNQLASDFNVSRRTIIRTLEEAGVDPGVKKRQPKAPKPAPIVIVRAHEGTWFRRTSRKALGTVAERLFGGIHVQIPRL